MLTNDLNDPANVPEDPTAEVPFAVPILPEFLENGEPAELPPFAPSLPEADEEPPAAPAEELPEFQAEIPTDIEPAPEEAPAAEFSALSAEEQAAPAEEVPVQTCSGLTEAQLSALLAPVSAQLTEQAAQTADEFSKVRTKLTDMDARISSLRRLADMHQDIEKKLNDEINEYKDNFYRRIVNPILVEFFEIQEDMHADALSADESAAALLNGHVDAITRTLRHYGVTVETVSVGDTYDPRLHKPVKAIPTEDPALDKTIAKTRQTLVHFIDGKIVERAQVQVYQYTPAAESAAPAAEPAAENTFPAAENAAE
ncbi:MAG: hypothetical protein IK130_11075 [Oscillospiraceae bacterium]|nr:hypothetical protein [Oscillospiraceae bacterium]